MTGEYYILNTKREMVAVSHGVWANWYLCCPPAHRILEENFLRTDKQKIIVRTIFYGIDIKANKDEKPMFIQTSVAGLGDLKILGPHLVQTATIEEALLAHRRLVTTIRVALDPLMEDNNSWIEGVSWGSITS